MAAGIASFLGACGPNPDKPSWFVSLLAVSGALLILAGIYLLCAAHAERQKEMEEQGPKEGMDPGMDFRSLPRERFLGDSYLQCPGDINEHAEHIEQKRERI